MHAAFSYYLIAPKQNVFVICSRSGGIDFIEITVKVKWKQMEEAVVHLDRKLFFQSFRL